MLITYQTICVHDPPTRRKSRTAAIKVVPHEQKGEDLALISPVVQVASSLKKIASIDLIAEELCSYLSHEKIYDNYR